ncbi:MAG: hypothetical protein BAJALOKI1v1_1010004 [Promethearchaeota archaeon]|nr:MAG: hypothetical protein BAJALOKI1v1_1010004 [Candidatus Lokiarchaeota archaeon]
MKYKKSLVISIILFILLFPLISIESTTGILTFEMNEEDKGTPAFYLTPILMNTTMELQVYSQNFEMYGIFIFAARPTESYLKPDETLDPKIFVNPYLLNYTFNVNPKINFTAPITGIYYIEIFLLTAEEDIYYVISTAPLSRYYIPEIPGFPVGITIGTMIGAILLTVVLYKKKILNIKLHS